MKLGPLAVAVFAALCTTFSHAQDLKLPSLSPSCSIVQEFSVSKIEINYSRPSMRGRTVFGDLVPFGTVWRTGANAATKITFGEDVLVAGTAVKAGTYSLYSIPGTTEWEIILNKTTGGWKAGGFDTKDDVARVRVKPSALPQRVETFTIDVSDVMFSSCSINLLWENTAVRIPVTATNGEQLVTNIEKAINEPNIPYFQAANYYYQTDQHLDKALDYCSKAVEKNPKAYWITMLKARIAAKLGKKDVARDAAQQTITIAKGTPGEAEYTKFAQDLLATLN